MTSATPPGERAPRRPSRKARARRRRALGARLLAETGVLWSALPVEWPRQPGPEEVGAAEDDEELPGWPWRVRQTLWALLTRPRSSFAEVAEPVSHASVLGLLATVRLPLWFVLLGLLGGQALAGSGATPPLRPIDDFVDPRLGGVVSTWLLLMVPVGLPLLYFFGGLVTHVALALTGGAPRSIAATMRAVGYALALPLGLLALLEVPLYLGFVPGVAAIGVLAAMGLLFFALLACALAGTHRIPLIRGLLVALVPLAFVLAVTFGRVFFVLPDLPGWTPPPISAYVLP
ncbi:MAG: hypothetical protein R3B09_28730 [Nannocystaceae bacterium]